MCKCMCKRESPFIAILQEILSDLRTHVCMTHCVCQSMRVHAFVFVLRVRVIMRARNRLEMEVRKFVKRFGSKSLFFLTQRRDLFLTFA